uniref:Tubulin alpha chain n=1 Tax=Leersia perrieri TaxID=77586 RepID=A0A0D9XT04_9ORYZ
MASSMAMIRIAIPAIPSSSGYCARARGRVAAAGMRVRCSGGGGGGSEGKGDGEEGPESLVAAAEFERAAAAADGQRARSMALNSEGLEGLVPRAKLLLSLGSTFFLGFAPLILISVSLFAVLYVYFGPSFVHDASKTEVSPPPYIDPYELLEDERLSRPSPDVF